MQWMRPVLAACAVLAAGCLSTPDGGGGDDGTPVAGAVPAFLAPVAVSDRLPGAEPVVAVATDGTLYVEGIGATEAAAGRTTNVNSVWRSTDGGASWTEVTPPFSGRERSNDGFVAVGNGDSVYAANVFSLTFQVFRSDDQGETWLPLNVPRLALAMHRHWILPVGDATVHVAVEALPPAFLTYFAGQPPPLDVPVGPNEGMWYFRSDDKGDTWTTPIQIDPVVNFAGQSNMAASPDGQGLYVVRYEEPDAPRLEPTYQAGHWYLLASADGGGTWERLEMFDLTSELASALPSLTVDADGTVWMVWSQESGGSSRVHYSFSTDQGRTWAQPQALPVGRGVHAMPWVVARGPAELGVMWYAAGVEGTASKVDAPWYVDYALVTDAAGPQPRAFVTRVTPEPIHHGNICPKGPACRGEEDRSLLDYPWMVYTPAGQAALVYASTEWELPSAFAVSAMEMTPFVAPAADRARPGVGPNL